MKQHFFETQHMSEWQAFEKKLEWLSARSSTLTAPLDLDLFPDQYRRLCHQYAIARERGYSLTLLNKLNDLILAGHRQLYRHRLPLLGPLLYFLMYDFPGAVREQKAWNLISAAAFLLPLIGLWTLVAKQPDMIYSLLDHDTVAHMEKLYDPDAGFRDQRQVSDDIKMFGYYIMNNIGIAFRTFASGIFLGVGALFVEVFNGAYFGAIAAHIINVEYQQPFFTFVVAHGAPELTAIVLSGGSGLRLGWALIAPGVYSRRRALQQAAQKAMPVMYGAFGLLLLAAFMEAFWSPRQFAPEIKYGVGIASWTLLYLYLLLAGRARRAA